MSLSTITFDKTNGGLSIPLEGKDHISGLIVYNQMVPSGFASNRIQQITSVPHAESKGIVAGLNWTGILHYYISEFFRLNKGAELHVYIADEVQTYDFTELKTLQDHCNGSMKQCGIYVTDTPFATSQVASIQTICDELEAAKMAVNVIYAPEINALLAYNDYTTFPSVRLTSKNVSVLIGADGAAKGKELQTHTLFSVPGLGAVLGAVSKSKVHESVAWTEKFQMASSELDVVMLSNGQSWLDFKDGADSLDNKGYMFFIKEPGEAGTYINFGHTCVPTTNDYCTIERNRTIDKAIRGINSSLFKMKNAPIYADPDTGLLTIDTIEHLKSVAETNPEQMKKDKELSGYEIIIDPNQDVITTNEIELQADLVPVGVAKAISVKIGYKVKLG